MRDVGEPRRLEILRVAWGIACLVAPSRVTSSLGGPEDRRTLAVTRLLGARHLVQGAVSGLIPSPRVLVLGGFVDFSHGATMALLGGLDPDRRRLAWTDGAIAAGWGAASLRDAHRAGQVAASLTALEG
jgi:hypothetical protein